MVADFFTERGVEHLLPLVRVLSQWRDRKKWVEKPLFPGYLFVRVDQEEVPRVRSVRGVARLVGPEANRPSILEDEEVENVRRLVSGEVPVDPYPYLRPGRAVRITRGPLRGVEGVLLRRQGRFLLVISVPIIGCSAVAEVPAEYVQVA
jgi:transcription antitermination factor NusG